MTSISPNLIILGVYVVGFFVAWRFFWPRIEADLHKGIEDFGDFASVVYLSFILSLIWPLILPVYAAYLQWKKSRVPG